MSIGRWFSRACAKNGEEIGRKCKEMRQKSQKKITKMDENLPLNEIFWYKSG